MTPEAYDDSQTRPACPEPAGADASTETFAPLLSLAEKMCEASGDSPVRTQFRQILAEVKESQGGLTNVLDQMAQRSKAREEASAKRLALVKERLAKKQAATQAALARQAERAGSASATARTARPRGAQAGRSFARFAAGSVQPDPSGTAG